jgi:hypothetical protein
VTLGLLDAAVAYWSGIFAVVLALLAAVAGVFAWYFSFQRDVLKEEKLAPCTLSTEQCRAVQAPC